MTTRNEQILEHLTGTDMGGGILGATAGVDSRVYRDRAEAFAQEELPALVVFPDLDDPTTEFSTCRTRWVLTLHILVLIGGSPVSRLADPIRASVHQILMAEKTLGGLAMTVRPGPARWEQYKGNEAPGVLDLTYQIEYLTDQDDLTL
jgi:hypothetical protein